MNKNQRKQIKNTLRMKRCRYCRTTENLTIDHKIPLIQGGSHELSNLQCLCKRCNGMKSNLTHGQVLTYWRWFNEIQRSRIEKEARPYFNEKGRN